MPELNELCFDYGHEEIDFNSNAKNLINVERIYFRNTQVENIISFIRYAPKVKEIQVDNLQEGTHFQNGIIDLKALDKERSELPGVCKITIYVSEKVFLSTKRALMKSELGLVTIKRAEAVEWKHVFDY